MDAIEWLVAPSIAGVSAGRNWKNIPKFPIPTSHLAEVTTSLLWNPPFILAKHVQALVLVTDSDIGHTLVNNVANNDSGLYVRKAGNVVCLGTLAPANDSNGRYLSTFQNHTMSFNGIYPTE